MTDLPTPTAARLARPSWRDTRLLVGVLIVLASVALGAGVVARADDRTPVYAARAPLVPGQRLTADDLSRVDVQLGSQQPHYLSAGGGLAPDRFVVRPVAAGELVPVGAVGGRDQVGVQPLVLSVDAGAAAALRVGSTVDVYVNRVDPGDEGGESGRAAGAGAGGGFLGPELTLEAVPVSSLPRAGGGLGGGAAGDRAVQVMAPTARIKEVIAAVDLGARITVVPVAGSAVRVEQ
ncbi:hypothetical protein SAMN04489867_1863 [Pedococcus dokdonensis]|uniref:SAF domain-containing protein n=1 Tax=Pedococcus dokdonensis TaxID=443156 RepID=A0A1H0R824_9MICO|nr:hypothetical protein [Pedococcus dokdonensis]SDP25206.1 hypothetical protein SAMN04489867_1863 [Pedococcus dokdonensis]